MQVGNIAPAAKTVAAPPSNGSKALVVPATAPPTEAAEPKIGARTLVNSLVQSAKVVTPIGAGSKPAVVPAVAATPKSPTSTNPFKVSRPSLITQGFRNIFMILHSPGIYLSAFFLFTLYFKAHFPYYRTSAPNYGSGSCHESAQIDSD